ncbi:hypothetical protein F383_37094 [Gossypium arboreum]|uniref:Uncharacterized protein n=1 Tax=Gossypium arboreum TaxID=29729 RepID=A0A0B0M6K0_GOSAR|nr:hypothetical protein F383_36965 [Gossypium arboreum]KHF97648.1 hypothetical protein F383_37094 [Gossypium arboreum]
MALYSLIFTYFIIIFYSCFCFACLQGMGMDDGVCDGSACAGRGGRQGGAVSNAWGRGGQGWGGGARAFLCWKMFGDGGLGLVG